MKTLIRKIQFKTRKYAVLINFIILILTVVLMIVFNALVGLVFFLVFEISGLGHSSILLTKRELPKLILFLWLVLASFLFVVFLQDSGRSFYSYFESLFFWTCFLGFITAIVVVPVFLFTYKDKKIKLKKYDLNQSIFFIYNRLGDRIAVKTSIAEIRKILLKRQSFNDHRHIGFDDIIKNITNDFPLLSKEDFFKIFYLENEYMKKVGVKQKDIYYKTYKLNFNI